MSWLWTRAVPSRILFMASGGRGPTWLICVAVRPSLISMPRRVPSAVGLARARLMTSSTFCSSAVGSPASHWVAREATPSGAAPPSRTCTGGGWMRTLSAALAPSDRTATKTPNQERNADERMAWPPCKTIVYLYDVGSPMNLQQGVDMYFMLVNFTIGSIY